MARTKTTKTVKPTKKRRLHAGTGSMRRARKLQDSYKLVVARSPFSRTMKRCITVASPLREYRKSGDARELLQEATEAYINIIVTSAAYYLKSVGKKTITAAYLKAVCDIRGEHHEANELAAIPDASINRLFLKGGILRVGEDAYNCVRSLIWEFAYRITRDAIVYTGDHLTVRCADVRASLERNGFPVWG